MPKWIAAALTAGLAAGMAASLQAQAVSPDLPYIPKLTLKPVDARQIGWQLPDFAGSTACDSDGNIYLRPALFLRFDKNPVWKISPEGRKLAEFAAPADAEDLGKEFRMGEFTLGGGGDFYALTYDGNATRMDYFLVSYASDGDVSSKTHLDLPADFWVDKFGVFATGDILISGHFTRAAAEALAGQPRVLLLKSDGTAAGEVKLSGEAAAKFEEPQFPQKGAPAPIRVIPQNAVSMGEDGNAYLLRGPEVLVVSARGKLLRTIPVSSPEPGFNGAEIQVSHGVLSVTFEKVDTKGHIEVMFRTFDASSGVVQAEYVAESGLSNVPLCFAANEGYTFLGQKDRKPALVRAWVR